jgi:hypothetical protein
LEDDVLTGQHHAVQALRGGDKSGQVNLPRDEELHHCSPQLLPDLCIDASLFRDSVGKVLGGDPTTADLDTVPSALDHGALGLSSPSRHESLEGECRFANGKRDSHSLIGQT